MGERLYEEIFFGYEAVTPTAHPKVLRVQLRALVPDFHVPLPPPPADDVDHRAAAISAERKLKLA